MLFIIYISLFIKSNDSEKYKNYKRESTISDRPMAYTSGHTQKSTQSP